MKYSRQTRCQLLILECTYTRCRLLIRGHTYTCPPNAPPTSLVRRTANVPSLPTPPLFLLTKNSRADWCWFLCPLSTWGPSDAYCQRPPFADKIFKEWVDADICLKSDVIGATILEERKACCLTIIMRDQIIAELMSDLKVSIWQMISHDIQLHSLIGVLSNRC